MKKSSKKKKDNFVTVIPGRTNQWRMSFYEPEDGEPSLSIRKFFIPQDKGDFIPTKNGFNLKPELAAEFYLALGKLLRTKKPFRVALKKAKTNESEEDE